MEETFATPDMPDGTVAVEGWFVPPFELQAASERSKNNPSPNHLIFIETPFVAHRY